MIRSSAKSLEDEMTRHALPLSLLLLTCVLCACGNRNAASDPSGATAPAVAQTSTAETSAAAPAPSAASPTGGDTAPGPISSHAATIDPTPNSQQAAGAVAAAGTIDFDLPKAWQSQTPSSSMRLAQAAIPGAAGPADFAVFYFGPGGGGPVEANINRWVGQMQGASKPEPETFETNGYKVTWLDVKGTMKPSQMGMGPAKAMPGARLFGAVVEGPGGPWFFKAQGPDATLAPQRGAFVAMMKSVRPKK
jgi:hypothetical protein